MKIEIEIPDKKYKKLNDIYKKLNKCLKKDLQKVTINFIEDTLEDLNLIL